MANKREQTLIYDNFSKLTLPGAPKKREIFW